MKNLSGTLLFLSLLLASLVTLFSHAQSQSGPNTACEFVKTEIIRGTDPGWESNEIKFYKQSKEYLGSLAADKRAARAQCQAMQDHGFVTAPEGLVNVHVEITSNQNAVTVDSIADRLAFEPSAFNLGFEIYGVLPDDSADGKIHDLITLLRHPTLGNIYVSERSLSTEPPGRRSKYIYGPKFDRTINGNPALFVVYKSRDGKRGRSAISILTGSRLITLSAGVPLMPGDDLYSTFMDLAQIL